MVGCTERRSSFSFGAFRGAVALVGSWALVAAWALEPVELRCEYRRNPMGLDVPAPRLSWALRSSRSADRATAYRILVASSPELLMQEISDLWDSGRIQSASQLHIPYAGRPLRSGERCWWTVRVWDREGAAGRWANPAWWEMGLLRKEDWGGARWIALDRDRDDRPADHAARPMMSELRKMTAPHRVLAFPSIRLRREFFVRDRVARARLYVCGLGLVEPWMNGERLGDEVLEPPQTTYDMRSWYVTRDATGSLRPGETNAVGLWLGNGFWGQNVAFTEALADGPPRAIALLAIEYADGGREEVVTGPDWQAATSAVLFDNIYAGETFDARLNDPGWSRAGGGVGGSWSAAVEVPSPTRRLQASMIPPMRKIRALEPVRVWPVGERRWVADFGQNLAGWVELHVREAAGTPVRLRFAELLDSAGRELDTASTGVFATGVEQQDILICGDGETRWEPRFTWHGFRYVEFEGVSTAPTGGVARAWLVRTAVEPAGRWESSDVRLNRIRETSQWTIESNLHGTAEDCPHRERCGWLGDAHAVGEAAIFHFEMGPFWTKFVDDIETVHGRGGVTYTGRRARPGIPCNIAVGRRLCQEARPDWGAACVLLPWYLWVYYGDLDAARRHYANMLRWVDYVEEFSREGIVVEGYGDWCPPGGNDAMECPVELTSTAYQYASFRYLAAMAAAMGRRAEAGGLERRAEHVRRAFLERFGRGESGDFGSQTAQAVAFRFGLVPPETAALAAQALARRIEVAGGHHRTGIHGARWLYTALADGGFDELAFRVLTAEGYPGYLELLARGCTTWPEVALPPSEDAAWRQRSHNHPMQAGFTAFFWEGFAGIRPDASAPGFGRLRMRPAGVRNLEWVRAEYRSLRGPIRSEWRRDGGRFEWVIALPPGVEADVEWPAISGAPADLQCVRADGSADGALRPVWAAGMGRVRLEAGEWRLRSRLPLGE